MRIDRLHTLALWKSCMIKVDRVNELKRIANLVMSYKESNYDPVEQATGVPWYVTGALDCRESNFDHTAYLGNGDPLNRPTRHVPRGRGPFSSWYEGAIDAFRVDAVPNLPPGGHWDIVTALIKCEAYNGLGYAAMGIPSPYIWGATNVQQPGKYVEDGHFDPRIWDQQPGCAAIFFALKRFYGVDLREA